MPKLPLHLSYIVKLVDKEIVEQSQYGVLNHKEAPVNVLVVLLLLHLNAFKVLVAPQFLMLILIMFNLIHIAYQIVFGIKTQHILEKDQIVLFHKLRMFKIICGEY